MLSEGSPFEGLKAALSAFFATGCMGKASHLRIKLVQCSHSFYNMNMRL